MLTGQTLPSCAKEVTNFRVENDLPIGDPEAEIRAYVGGTRISLGQSITLRQRVTSWKTNRQFQSHELVDEPEAERRAQICRDCPMNVQHWQDGCGACFAKTKQDLLALRQAREVKTKVGACNILGWDNSTSVWLTEASLKNRIQHLDKLPGFCWAKKL